MRILITILVLATSLFLQAQQREAKLFDNASSASHKYYSFSPLALAEPYMAIGLGFGNRFTERSEYFTELAYLNKSPFYDVPVQSLYGMRLILQYRYHFLQQWKPWFSELSNGKSKRSRRQPFIGLEFRTKTYNFKDKTSFVNASTADTLKNYFYKANSTVIGGALIFGSSYDFGEHGRVRLEVTWGIGSKQKLVAFKNVPAHYKIPVVIPYEYGWVPKVYESTSEPYFPFALRFRILL